MEHIYFLYRLTCMTRDRLMHKRSDFIKNWNEADLIIDSNYERLIWNLEFSKQSIF